MIYVFKFIVYDIIFKYLTWTQRDRRNGSLSWIVIIIQVRRDSITFCKKFQFHHNFKHSKWQISNNNRDLILFCKVFLCRQLLCIANLFSCLVSLLHLPLLFRYLTTFLYMNLHFHKCKGYLLVIL